MAQRVIVTLIDDIDGGKADETIQFALNGQGYEVDLCNKNADDLREKLKPFIKGGRRVKSSSRGPKKSTPVNSSRNTAAIREWARSNGRPVNNRGRIPADIESDYQKAQEAIQR